MWSGIYLLVPPYFQHVSLVLEDIRGPYCVASGKLFVLLLEDGFLENIVKSTGSETGATLWPNHSNFQE